MNPRLSTDPTSKPARKGTRYRALLALLLVLALLTPVWVPPAAAQEKIGEISNLEHGAFGTLIVRGRILLAEFDPVFETDFLETLPRAGLTVRFEDDTVFHLGSDSSARLEGMLLGRDSRPSSGLINLGRGLFRFISNGEDDQGLTFSTPTSTIDLQGTDFFVINSEDGRTKIGTVSGLVDFTPNGADEAIELRPGFYASLGEEQGDVVVRNAPVRASDLACWLAGDDHICRAEARDFANAQGSVSAPGLGSGNGGGLGASNRDEGGGGAGESNGRGPQGNRSGGGDGTNPGGAGNESGDSNPGGS